mgnify:CR=1 FL=1
MSRPDPGSRAAELRTALLRAGRARHEDFQVTLAHFAVERLLHRLSGTRHAESFVLKGAMLLGVWTIAPHRATRDVDFLGFGSPAPEALAEVFREIARADGEEDAVEFDPLSVRAEEIREDSRYDGVRVRLEAPFGSARIPVQVDIGFGDARSTRRSSAVGPRCRAKFRRRWASRSMQRPTSCNCGRGFSNAPRQASPSSRSRRR